MKYIAYGSNMVQEQMVYRCPDAKLLGIGYIEHARLEFYLYATVERSEIKDARVPVAVWEISDADEQHLDWYEGYPNFYTKEEWTVRMTDGSEIKGMIYLMNKRRFSPPTAHYFDAILKAYEDLGLSTEIETVLQPALKRSFRRMQC